MNTTLKDWIDSDPERAREFAQEQLIVAVAEHIWEQMEQRDASKTKIAAALGKSKAFITQLLDGTRNMTLRSLSDIAFVLDARVEVEFHPRREAKEWDLSSTPKAYTNVLCERRIDHAAVPAGDAPRHELVHMRFPKAA